MRLGVGALIVLLLSSISFAHPAAFAFAQRADPTLFLLSQDELPPGFVRQANRDEDLTTPTWSHASRVYWRFNPEIGPDDITSLHMGITVYDSPGQASAGLASLYPELLRNFELVESTSDVGEEAVRMWHSIAQPGVRQAEAWYILFRVGPVVARSRWGDFDDLPNHEHALDLAVQLEAKLRGYYAASLD
jgi:hypothetical protein